MINSTGALIILDSIVPVIPFYRFVFAIPSLFLFLSLSLSLLACTRLSSSPPPPPPPHSIQYHVSANSRMCTFRRDFNSNHIANTFSFIMAFVRANTISQSSPYCSIVPYNIRRRYLEPPRARGAARSTLKHTQTLTMDPRWLQSRATVENYRHVTLYLYFEFVCVLFKRKIKTIEGCVFL